MRPVLFRIGPLSIYSYAFFLWIGLTLGLVAGSLTAKAIGLPEARVFVVTSLLMVPALAGSRLAHVMGHWREYRDSLGQVFRPGVRGLAMLGGFVAALAVSIPVVPAAGLPFWRFWDVGVVTILVGMVPTRLGCLLTGCCGGRASASWVAMMLPDARGVWARRLPMQAFEAVTGLALLGLAMWMVRAPSGVASLTVISGYGLVRLALDPWRDGTRPVVAGLSGHQILCAGMTVAGLVALTWRLVGPDAT
jgi:phosphatidylglycerol:prolipoprotein diacylglycerol transferase